MKKFLVSLVAVSAIFLSSCTREERSHSDNGVVQMSIDGKLKTFAVTSHSASKDDGTTWITFGTTSGTESLSMSINEGDTTLESFSYTVGNVSYTGFVEDFTSNATSSTLGRLIGTFSGTLENDDSNKPDVNITSGIFKINYYLER